MKRNALRKDFYMEIKRTFSRFLSLVLIVALGVAFYAGIRSTEPDMYETVDKMYDDSNFFDLRILSGAGMNDEELSTLKGIDCIDDAEGIYYIDAFAATKDKRYTVKLSSIPEKIGKLVIQEGRMPENDNECVIDTQLFNSEHFKIGDLIDIESGSEVDASTYLENTKYTIVGTYTSPYYLQIDKGTTQLGAGKINGLVSIAASNFRQQVYSELYASVKDAKNKTTYSASYENVIEKAMTDVNEHFDNEKYYLLDRNSIQSYVEFGLDAKRIGKIGGVVPIIFFLVAALVSLTTMTRMVEEERTQIGTLKALGYGKYAVAKKYFYYALGATVTGSVIGAIAGSIIIPRIIINAYMIMYQNLGKTMATLKLSHILTASLIAIMCVTLSALAACYKELASSSAALMRPVAPKNGKRVFLERIGFIWKHLTFTWKSTVRNLVRYKKRFFMTIFGIAGSMGLIVLGFGIKDSISSIVSLQYNKLRQYNNEFSLKSNLNDDELLQVNTLLDNDERVVSYQNSYQSTMDAESGKKTLSAYIFVPKDYEKIKNYVKIVDRDTGKYIDFTDDSVVISEKMAKLMNLSVGDTFTLKPTNTTKIQVKVGAICENYVYHYIFLNEKLYEQLFGEKPYYNELFIKNTSEYYDEEKFMEDMLATGYINGANSIDTLRNKFDEMLQGMDIIILVIIISAGGLAFVVLYNLNNINISERKRELASLKVLGFYDNEVSAYVFRENIILTIIGIMCGAVFGIWIHKYVIDTIEVDLVMFGRHIKMLSYVYSTLITLAFTIVINAMMHYKLKKIEMAASMKSVE